MSDTATRTIRLSLEDNVVVARHALRSGTAISEEDLTTVEAIDPGHKIATRAIKRGDTVRKYDQIIGVAEADIQPGQHVHTHNLRMDEFDRDYQFCQAVKKLDYRPEPERATYQGLSLIHI